MAIIYIWSQYYRDVIVNFIFGINFQGVYLPYALLILEMFQIGIPWASIIGLVTGHLYYYLDELYPASGGARLLNTPQWLYRYFPRNTTASDGVRISFGTILNPGRNRQTESSTSTRSWGRAHRLGS